MESVVFWQQGNADSESEAKLAQVEQWWSALAGKPILWQQRPLPESHDRAEINWEIQKFDETFNLVAPQLRGITLYWQKESQSGERNLTASALQLSLEKQFLEVMPDSTRNYVVRITSREPNYRRLVLDNPSLEYLSHENGHRLIFKDSHPMIAIEIQLNDLNFSALCELLTHHHHATS